MPYAFFVCVMFDCLVRWCLAHCFECVLSNVLLRWCFGQCFEGVGLLLTLVPCTMICMSPVDCFLCSDVAHCFLCNLLIFFHVSVSRTVWYEFS